MADIQYYGTGRRKTSTARVYLRPGSGKIVVNKREFDAYFPNEALRMIIRQPLNLTESVEKFDIPQIAATAHFQQAHDSICFPQSGMFYAQGSASLIGGLWRAFPDRSTWLSACQARSTFCPVLSLTLFALIDPAPATSGFSSS